MFTINEIIGASSSIPISLDENDTIEKIVQSLHVGNLKTTTSYTADFTSIMNDLFPKITFVGKSFAFGLSRTKFSSQFLRAIEFVRFDQKVRIDEETPSNLFAKENLDQISLDFNYLLGLIFGKLNLDNKNYEFNFTIHVSKEIPDMYNLKDLLIPESKTILGEIKDFYLQGVNVSLTENLFDTEVQSQYNIRVKKDDTSNNNSFDVHSEFKFKHSGPIDFYKIVSESINRLNNITKSVMEDANESNS